MMTNNFALVISELVTMNAAARIYTASVIPTSSSEPLRDITFLPARPLLHSCVPDHLIMSTLCRLRLFLNTERTHPIPVMFGKLA